MPLVSPSVRPVLAVFAAALSLTSSALAGPVASSPPAPTSPSPAPSAEAPSAELGSPSLARVIGLAKERAPDVMLSRADVAIGRAAYAGASLGPLANPYLELTANRGTAGATKDIAMQATLFVPFEVSGQRSRRMAEADAFVAFQTATLEAVRAQAAGLAVRSFGTAAVASARVHTYEGIVEVARAEAAVYSARLEAGDATEQDEKLAKVELSKNSVILAESRADLIRALVDLERLTGVRFAAPSAASAAPPAPNAHVHAGSSVPLVEVSAREAVFHARERERQAREAHNPLNVILIAGRGDLGEARLGGGLSFTFPFFRQNQGEQARADAARARSLLERDTRARLITVTLEGLTAERNEVRRALVELTEIAEPAAQASVEAALRRQRAGKGELLHVLTARRDLALLAARRLELLLREWTILGDIVALTGEMP